MNFLTLLLQNIQSEGKRKATLDIVEKTFSQILSSPLNPKSKKKNLKEALESQDEYGKATLDFLNRMDIEDAGSQGGIMFLNGKLIEFGEEMVSTSERWTKNAVTQRMTYTALDSNFNAGCSKNNPSSSSYHLYQPVTRGG